MLGEAKFKRNDQVSFTYDIQGMDARLKGVVYVVDPHGTEEQQEEPSYDIEALFKGRVLLFKHVRESNVELREEI